MKEFLSIREFSKQSGIEVSTLRYWDEIGLFTPAKRDPETNYRYYAPDQMIAVNFITVLSKLNVPLKTIAEAESKRDPEKLIRLIDQQEKQLDMDMSRLREQYSIIHARRELINDGMKVDDKAISISHMEKKTFILGPRNDWERGEEFYEPFTNFCNQAEELRINLSFPIAGIHDSFDAFLEAPGEPHYFFSLDPTGNRHRAAGNYLIGYNRGYYGQFGDLPERMAAYIKEHSLTISGPLFAIYLHDEICIKDPSQYLVRVSVAISK